MSISYTMFKVHFIIGYLLKQAVGALEAKYFRGLLIALWSSCIQSSLSQNVSAEHLHGRKNNYSIKVTVYQCMKRTVAWCFNKILFLINDNTCLYAKGMQPMREELGSGTGRVEGTYCSLIIQIAKWWDWDAGLLLCSLKNCWRTQVQGTGVG